MEMEKSPGILEEQIHLKSQYLDRSVTVNLYVPNQLSHPWEWSLLLINDGQDMEKLGFRSILEDLNNRGTISPLLCAAIHAGSDRRLEYGTALALDFKGRGSKARNYTLFVLNELLPFVHDKFGVGAFKEKAMAGFSLGGLSALDITLNHPQEFSRVGVFSGSLWWRSKDKHDKSYNDATDRIMHQQVRAGGYYPWLRFFFECGAADEWEDRNNNGVIDSIDDTMDLIRELRAKGYDGEKDIYYLQIDDGKHDIPTWARAMPEFLLWGWGR
jgi:enterochelin esterase-like enzyme